MIRRPPRPPLFPSTTLSRSEERNPPAPIELTAVPIEVPEVWSRHQAGVPRLLSVLVHAALAAALMRSEEHTSELQSQSNLVCRLLLEKKKTRPVCALIFSRH